MSFNSNTAIPSSTNPGVLTTAYLSSLRKEIEDGPKFALMHAEHRALIEQAIAVRQQQVKAEDELRKSVSKFYLVSHFSFYFLISLLSRAKC